MEDTKGDFFYEKKWKRVKEENGMGCSNIMIGREPWVLKGT